MRIVAILCLVILAACTPPMSAQRIGPNGEILPTVYRISSSQSGNIQLRVLDSVNALRQAAGVPQVQLDSRLNAAAATHARDMSVQNRPWHFGSDGSSPLDRVARTGYSGRFVGENISETYETEMETLAAWAADPNQRAVLLDDDARAMGFEWYQEPSGKIWWTLVMGS